MYKRILMPFDGSAQALCAVPHAAELARLGDGEVLVMYAFEPIACLVEGEAHEKLQEDGYNQALAIVEPALHALQKLGVHCHPVLVEGVPSQSIVRLAHEKHCDLIVMGTNGRDTLEELFRGSITERVLRASSLPVLVTGCPC